MSQARAVFRPREHQTVVFNHKVGTGTCHSTVSPYKAAFAYFNLIRRHVLLKGLVFGKYAPVKNGPQKVAVYIRP
jgi:hypothetical protein